MLVMENRFSTTSNAYMCVLDDLLNGTTIKSAPRGLPIKELIDYKFIVTHPDSKPIRTLDEERNLVISDYTQKEFALYNSCTNQVEDFAKASSFWRSIANADGTINSAYGFLIWKNISTGDNGTQWDWAVQSLKSDRDSRQAFVRFSLPQHQYAGNKDQTCTMHGNFLIRDGSLHLTVVMRSNDVVKGLVYDMPWFCSLMDKMLVDLKDTYPDLKKGNYTHFAHSLHMYRKDEPIVQKMLGLNQ